MNNDEEEDLDTLLGMVVPIAPLDQERIVEAEEELKKALKHLGTLQNRHAFAEEKDSDLLPEERLQKNNLSNKKKKRKQGVDGYEELPWNSGPRNLAWDQFAHRISDILGEKKRHLMRCIVYSVGDARAMELLKETAVKIHTEGGLYYTRRSRAAEEEPRKPEAEKEEEPPVLNIFQMQERLAHNPPPAEEEKTSSSSASGEPGSASPDPSKEDGKKSRPLKNEEVKRTAGGTFIKLLRNGISAEQWKTITSWAELAFAEWKSRMAKQEPRKRQKQQQKQQSKNK